MTQLNHRWPNTSLSHNLGTIYPILGYNRINSLLFTDNVFVTKGENSTRGFLCMQLFVSDKGYVKIHPTKTPSGFTDALKKFAKEVEAK